MSNSLAAVHPELIAEWSEKKMACIEACLKIPY